MRTIFFTSFSAALALVILPAFVQAQTPIQNDPHSRGFEATDEAKLHAEVEAFVKALQPSDANHEIEGVAVSYDKAVYDVQVKSKVTEQMPKTYDVVKTKQFVQVPFFGSHQGANKKSSGGRAKCADPDRVRIAWRGFVGTKQVKVGTETRIIPVTREKTSTEQQTKYLAVVTWDEKAKQSIQIIRVTRTSAWENANKNRSSHRPCYTVPGLQTQYAKDHATICGLDLDSKKWLALKVSPTGGSGGGAGEDYFQVNSDGSRTAISPQQFKQLQQTPNVQDLTPKGT